MNTASLLALIQKYSDLEDKYADLYMFGPDGASPSWKYKHKTEAKKYQALQDKYGTIYLELVMLFEKRSRHAKK